MLSEYYYIQESKYTQILDVKLGRQTEFMNH